MATIMMLGTQRVRLCACCAARMPNVARETDVDVDGCCEACGEDFGHGDDSEFTARMSGLFYAAFDSILPVMTTIPCGGASGLYR